MIVKKIAFIVLGFLVGIVFDMAPHAFEVVARPTFVANHAPTY